MKKNVFEISALSLVLLGIIAFVLASPVFAGGGGSIVDGRPVEWLGQVGAQVDFESLAFNGGIITAVVGGKAAILDKYNDGVQWLVINQTNIYCSHPIWDNNGIVGYDVYGRLCKWANGTSEILSKIRLKETIRPAFSPDKIVFGGGNQLMVMVRNGKTSQINLGKLKINSVTFSGDDNGEIYFTASEDHEASMLYVAFTIKGGGYKFWKVQNMKAEQVFYAATRLYLVDKWGITSWYLDNSSNTLMRDAVIEPGAGPYVLLGGNAEKLYFFAFYGSVSTVGVPDGFG